MNRWPVASSTMTSALGRGLAAHAEASRAGSSGLRLQRFETAHFVVGDSSSYGHDIDAYHTIFGVGEPR